MTQEQLVALVSAIYTIIIFVNNTKLGKSIMLAKKDSNTKVDKEVTVLREERSVLEQRVERLENQNAYFVAKRKRDLQTRLEITNDEKERQEILDELETLSKMK
jgi:cell division protein FtsB